MPSESRLRVIRNDYDLSETARTNIKINQLEINPSGLLLQADLLFPLRQSNCIKYFSDAGCYSGTCFTLFNQPAGKADAGGFVELALKGFGVFMFPLSPLLVGDFFYFRQEAGDSHAG